MYTPVKRSIKLVAVGAVMIDGAELGSRAAAGVSKPCKISLSVLYGNGVPRIFGKAAAAAAAAAAAIACWPTAVVDDCIEGCWDVAAAEAGCCTPFFLKQKQKYFTAKNITVVELKKNIVNFQKFKKILLFFTSKLT